MNKTKDKNNICITNKYIISKTIEFILTLFLVSIISFLLVKLSPVDAAEAYAQRVMFTPSEAEIEALRVSMGVYDPIWVQYIDWLKGAVVFDFGTSYVNGLPVLPQLLTSLGFTISIVGLVAILDTIIVVLMGSIMFALRKKWIKALFVALCLIALSVPPFFYATTFINFFSVKLGLTQIIGNQGLMRYLPAAICYIIGTSAFFIPLFNINLEKIMKSDSAYYARCRGLSESKIVIKYALPVAITSLIPSFFQMLGLSFAGSIIVERVFALPGLGNLIMTSVLGRDVPLIHTTLLTLAVILAVFNILADISRRLISKNDGNMEVL